MKHYTLPTTDFEFDWKVTGKELIEAEDKEGVDIADIQSAVQTLQDTKRIAHMFKAGSNIIYLGLQSKDEYSLADVQEMLTIEMVSSDAFSEMIQDMVTSIRPPKPPKEALPNDVDESKKKDQ